MKRIRNNISLFHRWTGLALGLYISLVAISGTAMVFQANFYEWEFGSDIMAFEERPQAWALPSIWIEKAQAKYGPLNSIEGIFGPETTPMRITSPTIIYDGKRSNGDHGHGVVIVDPYTGDPKAHFIAEDTWAIWPLWLHNSLFLGDFVIPTLMALSILTLLFCFSGLFLWLQRSKIKRSDLAFSGISSPQNLRKSHTAMGLWLSIPIFIFAVTGFGLARVDLAMQFAEVLGRSDGDVAPASHERCEASYADEVWTTALELNPGGDIKLFFVPTGSNPRYQIFMGPAGSRFPTRGDSELRVNSECSELTYFRPAQSNELGDYMLTYMLDIHNGKILGVAGDVVIFILGVIIFLLPITAISAHFWRMSFQKK